MRTIPPPALIAIDMNTGKLVWEDNSVFEKILHGQWASPTVARIGGVDGSSQQQRTRVVISRTSLSPTFFVLDVRDRPQVLKQILEPPVAQHHRVAA